MSNWREEHEALFFSVLIIAFALVCYLTYLCVRLFSKCIPKLTKAARNLCGKEAQRGRHHKINTELTDFDRMTELTVIGESESREILSA